MYFFSPFVEEYNLIDNSTDISIGGVMVNLVNEMLHFCCSYNNTFHIQGTIMDNAREVEKNINKYLVFTFPVTRGVLVAELFQASKFQFLPVIQTSGKSFLFRW